jgi:nucleotide sugar dehydrogenase
MNELLEKLERTEETKSATARPVVCVQGLGFVGAAMALAVANARRDDGSPRFDVVGVDLPTTEGNARIAALNDGKFPFESGDPAIDHATTVARAQQNLAATSDPRWYERASVVIVDVHCDIKLENGRVTADLDTLRKAVRTLGAHIRPDTLVIVETTVPPGTCQKLVAPTLRECLRERGLPENAFHLAHSYERVMPGKDYYRSIVSFWRVFAGLTESAAVLCETFLRQVINTDEYPLTRLASTTASETAKVLENTYRAATIAFIDEWGRFAEAAGIDLFEVIDAIRMRPTHSNIRQPGFGVGGYCLTKDPLFGKFAAETFFDRPDLSFPFSTRAVETNSRMPMGAVERLMAMFPEGLQHKNILLAGVSYRPDVGDTRYSPSADFVRAVEQKGAAVACYDPLVSEWPEMKRKVETTLPAPARFDAIVFAVDNERYHNLDFRDWLGSARPAILDANNILSRAQRHNLRALGCRVESVGRGDAL